MGEDGFRWFLGLEGFEKPSVRLPVLLTFVDAIFSSRDLFGFVRPCIEPENNVYDIENVRLLDFLIT